MKLSDLYQISIDELLKGDQRMKRKIEEDANVAKANERVILTTAIIAFGIAIIYLISTFVGGAFYEFCASAIQWVVMGIGVACAVSLNSIKKSCEE